MTLEEQIAAALAAPYVRVFQKQADGGYQAYVVEMPGGMTAGDTLEETNELLEEVMAIWLEYAIADGQPIPPPFEDPGVLLDIGREADRTRMEAHRAGLRDSA